MENLLWRRRCFYASQWLVAGAGNSAPPTGESGSFFNSCIYSRIRFFCLNLVQLSWTLLWLSIIMKQQFLWIMTSHHHLHGGKCWGFYPQSTIWGERLENILSKKHFFLHRREAITCARQHEFMTPPRGVESWGLSALLGSLFHIWSCSFVPEKLSNEPLFWFQTSSRRKTKRWIRFLL